MTKTQKNIYTIDQNADFLSSLAKGILEKTDNDPQKLQEAEIFLPNKRSVLHLKYEFVKLSKSNACIMPKIRSIGFEDEEELSLKVMESKGSPPEIPEEIPKYERIFKLAQLIRSYDGAEISFKDISHKQSVVLAFSLAELLDDCQKFQTDNIEGLKNIFSEELSAHKQISLEFLNFIFREFPRILEEKNMTEPVARRNIITEELAELYASNNNGNHVFLAGSTGTLPATRKLIRAISELDNGYIILPYTDLDLTDHEWQDISDEQGNLNHQIAIKNLLEYLDITREDIKIFHKTNRKSFSKVASEIMKPAKFCRDWKNNKINAEEMNSIQIAEMENSTEETKLIALLVKEAVSKGKKCAVITENKKLIDYLKSTLKRFHITIDDSIGTPYYKTEEGKFLLNIADLISSEFRTSILIELLKSPMLEFENDAEISKHKQLTNDLEKNIARKYSCKTIRSLTNKLEKTEDITGEQQKFFKKYIFELNNYINELNKEPKVNYQILSRSFNEIVSIFLTKEQIANLNDEARTIIEQISSGKFFTKIDRDDLKETFSALFSRINVHAPNYLNSPVSVLAPIEARLLFFERTIIAGVNLGSFPKESFSAWMNKPMKRDFGLPPEELDISLIAHDFSTLLQSEEVFITRSTYDNCEPTSPSPFLTRTKGFLEAQKVQHEINPEYIEIIKQLNMQNYERKEEERPAPKPSTESRPNKVSATSVEKIIKNPYWFYAKEILKLKNLENLEKPTDRRVFGNFVHSALEEFSNSHKLDKSKIKISELNRIFTKHFEHYANKEGADISWLLEAQKISPWIVETELKNADQLKSSIAEAKGICKVEGLILTAKADRLDVDKEGNLNVIDYKTGRTPTEANVKNLISPQLLLELLIATNGGFSESGLKSYGFKDIGQAIYYCASLSDKGPKLKEIQSIDLEEVKHELKNLSMSIKDPNTPFLAYPNKKLIPEYDDYFLLARYEKEKQKNFN